VLVVTGTGAERPQNGRPYRAQEIDADADHFLAALGLGRR